MSGVTNTSAPPPYSARSDVGARSGALDTCGFFNAGPAVHHIPPPYSAHLEAGARLGVSGASGYGAVSGEPSFTIAGQPESIGAANPPDPFTGLPLAPIWEVASHSDLLPCNQRPSLMVQVFN